MTQTQLQADKRRLAGQATRDRLLAAAEFLFANRGFDATSTRALVEEAGVDLAMIVYHFGSKLGLYREVLLHRAERLNAVRLAELEEALAGSARPSLEAIVHALVATNIRLRTDPALGGLPVARLIARELIDPEQADRNTIGAMFDDLAQRFIAALKSTMPGASDEAVHWAYHFAISAMVLTMANVSRLEDLSEGACDMSDSERVIEHLVAFVVSGIRGCVAAHEKIPARVQAAASKRRNPPAPRPAGNPATKRKRS